MGIKKKKLNDDIAFKFLKKKIIETKVIAALPVSFIAADLVLLSCFFFQLKAKHRLHDDKN